MLGSAQGYPREVPASGRRGKERGRDLDGALLYRPRRTLSADVPQVPPPLRSLRRRPALPGLSSASTQGSPMSSQEPTNEPDAYGRLLLDRKSTRLNSSHLVISYAVFCL